MKTAQLMLLLISACGPSGAQLGCETDADCTIACAAGNDCCGSLRARDPLYRLRWGPSRSHWTPRPTEVVAANPFVQLVKNKLARPFREADFEILFGTGINKLGELVDTGEKLGLLEKSGTWYSYGGEKLGQGRDKALAHLDEPPALQQQLRDALMKQARANAAMTPTRPAFGSNAST